MDRQALQERFGIIGTSDALRRVLDRVRQVARTDITVLLEGESGVGKELFAQAIHGIGDRKHKKLVVVNCGAIPEGLIEAELFGAEKGAYTGSVERRTGYFEEADGGTIFLDEIGELPVQAQVRLLRVLENGTFSRVGSSTQQQVDVRVVAATNKDLGREVGAGRFREDLYYRLSTVVVRIPPIRRRAEDIVPIFETLLYRASQRFDAPLRKLDAGAHDLLTRYNWPGNVREIRNVAEQAAVLIRGNAVTADDLRPFLRGVSAGSLVVLPKENGEARERELLYRALLELRSEVNDIKAVLRRLAGSAEAIPLPASFAAPDPNGPASISAADLFSSTGLFGGERGDEAFAPPAEDEDYDRYVEDVPYVLEEDEEPARDEGPRDVPTGEETEPNLTGLLTEGSALRLGPGALPTMEETEQALIAEALRRFDGNRRETAKALGISERTLYRKIKDLEALGVEV
ncbi:MAG: sigma 54-interacting transcriptional regulator [Bacteroidota bacterium]